MGTPIINLPQTGTVHHVTLMVQLTDSCSAVLGLHAIKDKPVAMEGKVEIRPVCALSVASRMLD